MANYNPNLVKVNRNYTFEELAAVFSVHKNTVAMWVKNDLPCLKERRPFLILGVEAKAYLKNQRVGKKQKCQPNELYCLRCKKPSIPAEGFVEYSVIGKTKGLLTGFCSRCECEINKFIGLASLVEYQRIFEVTIPRELKHISDSDNPLLNSDFKREIKP
jgi:hypothetical protein